MLSLIICYETISEDGVKMEENVTADRLNEVSSFQSLQLSVAVMIAILAFCPSCSGLHLVYQYHVINYRGRQQVQLPISLNVLQHAELW